MAACLVLILITSMGIYGFLSSAYQETANASSMVDSEIALVEVKRDNINKQLEVYNAEKVNIDEGVADLRSGLANNVIQYKDPETGELITTTSSATRRALENQLEKDSKRQSELNIKIDTLNSQLFAYETEILEIKASSDVAGELGPLKYLAGLTGWPMDKIINILLLTIIFVFDPLAIALVIAANYAFERLKKKDEEEGTILEDTAENTPREGEEVLSTNEVVLEDDSHKLDMALNDLADSIYDDSEVQSVLRHKVEGGTEGEDELRKKLASTPKSHKYGPDGWKTIKRKLDEIEVKKRNDDEDYIIRY